jgi:hypothetical protein
MWPRNASELLRSCGGKCRVPNASGARARAPVARRRAARRASVARATFKESLGLLAGSIVAFVSERPTRRPDAHIHCDCSATPLL